MAPSSLDALLFWGEEEVKVLRFCHLTFHVERDILKCKNVYGAGIRFDSVVMSESEESIFYLTIHVRGQCSRTSRTIG